MKQVIIQHFRKMDPVIAEYIDKVGIITVVSSRDHFSDLVESIICQQLSDKAGATIFARFRHLFPRGRISAHTILDISGKKIRETGPSWSKVNYIKNVAVAVVSKQLNMKRLSALEDEAVIGELTRIKGIGRWTAEMFLMFSLGREDVFSFGDLGLRRAVQKLYKIRKEPTEKQLKKISQKWSPYRTYAARILWRSLDVM